MAGNERQEKIKQKNEGLLKQIYGDVIDLFQINDCNIKDINTKT